MQINNSLSLSVKQERKKFHNTHHNFRDYARRNNAQTKIERKLFWGRVIMFVFKT